jgi:post-segregation antitoxin (ccd killing protein)
MRSSLYDADARRRTVSLTLNADLCAKAKAAGINLSRVAEEALAHALALRVAEQTRAEIQRDLAAHDAFIEQHGSFARMIREHYAAADDDASV